MEAVALRDLGNKADPLHTPRSLAATAPSGLHCLDSDVVAVAGMCDHSGGSARYKCVLTLTTRMHRSCACRVTGHWTGQSNFER
jgi:hypothetical protein